MVTAPPVIGERERRYPHGHVELVSPANDDVPGLMRLAELLLEAKT